MKRKIFNKIAMRLTLPLLIMFFGFSLSAQVPTTQVLPDTTKMTYNQISQTGGMVVFPSKDQSKQQQKEVQQVKTQLQEVLKQVDDHQISRAALIKLLKEQLDHGKD